jgi:predicted DNA-binding transcriptional regulator YafY
MMRRADRLFQIVQCLRRVGGVITAAQLAAELEVTPRTVYRDIADLQARRVPIEGAAGVGYVLRDGYTLPALMFTEDEIEALVLGARVVQSWADAELGAAAANAMAKIEAVLPEGLRPRAKAVALMAPPRRGPPPTPGIAVPALRRAIRAQRKLHMDYADTDGRSTQRTVWPLALSFFPPVWLLAAWCELRGDFRAFRLDRIRAGTISGDAFPAIPGRRLVDFVAMRAAERARDAAAHANTGVAIEPSA